MIIMETINMLLSVEETAQLIGKNRTMVLAGNENILRKLPKGNWIGGTIPYFMDAKGGCIDKERVFVSDLSELAIQHKIKSYDGNHIQEMMDDRYDQGFSFVLLPGFSDVLSSYAMKTHSMSDIYNIPTMGWVTGIDLSEVGKNTPKVFNGSTGETFENKSVVLHIELPANKTAGVEIINIFSQGNGDTLTFEKEGFEFSECLVNGEKQNLVKYLQENNIDTRLPLVADYSGAQINISFQQVNQAENKVLFYAPLHKDIEYKMAKPVGNYVTEFNSMLPGEINVAVSCNCILNYLYSELEGKKTGIMRGPITFGEIAYVLVNQTLVYLNVQ
jgi:hypothetical protein